MYRSHSRIKQTDRQTNTKYKTENRNHLVPYTLDLADTACYFYDMTTFLLPD